VPEQLPFEQPSFIVQASPSSQEAVLCVFTHPDPGSQKSSVQIFPSLQFTADPD
jgi:hypothetical protein